MKDEGKILVTGASGFVGGRVVEILHLTNNRNVCAGIRSWSSAARIGRFPVDIVKFDLMNTTEIDKVMDGVSMVVHCAKGPNGPTDIGTKNLLASALKHKIKRFVHLSTTEIYGNASGVVSEEHPYQYTGSEYNESKIKAEQYCTEYLEKGLPISILRPPIIYGPFGTYWTIYFANMLIARKWGIYDKFGNGKCNLLYIDDLVRAIMTVLKNDNAIGQIFNINGPEIVTWNEYFQRYNNLLGLPELKHISAMSANLRSSLMQPVRMLGRYVRDHHMVLVKKISDRFDFAKKIMKKTENEIKSTPGLDDLNLYNRNVFYDITKAEEVLGYTPKFDVDRGLRISVKWVEHQGFFIHNAS